MQRYTCLLLLTLGIITGCSKDSPSNSYKKLYTQSLDQIKKTLKGSWNLRSVCNVTIEGSACRNITGESLIFSDTDSIFWIKDNKITKKVKIQFIRIKSLYGFDYETDSIYVFKFAKEEFAYLRYDIIQASLIIESATSSIDAWFRMILTKSK